MIFEQKRSCDQIVGDLEFELEGYFQRRLSHGGRERSDVKFQVTHQGCENHNDFETL